MFALCAFFATGCAIPLLAPPLRSTGSIGGGVGSNPLAAPGPAQARGSLHLTAVPQTMIAGEMRRHVDVGVGWGWFYSGAPVRQGPVVDVSYYPVVWPSDAEHKKSRAQKQAARKADRESADRLAAQEAAKAGKPPPPKRANDDEDDEDELQDEWTARLALRLSPQMLLRNAEDARYGGAITALFGIEIQTSVSSGCGGGGGLSKDGAFAAAACYRGAFGIGIGLQSSYVVAGDTRYASLGIGLSLLTPGIIGGAVGIPNPALFIPRR